MNILFTRFPLQSIINGGAEKQTIALMKGLRERGHDVSFAGSCSALLKMCKAEGIKTHHLDIGQPPVTKGSAISFLWRMRSMRKKLKKILTEANSYKLKANIVVMLSLTEKLLLTDIASKKGVKVFWIEHDRIGNWLRKNPWLKLLLRQSQLATTIVVSELSKKLYNELGWKEKNLLAIPNGIDLPSPRGRGVGGEGLRLACIARLSPEKGVDILLEAIKDLPNISLTIIGTGPEQNTIKKMIVRINESTLRRGSGQAPQRINVLTNIKNPAGFYSQIDALVLPSRDHDPFGLVAAEAMMAGVPIIVTDACGIASYLDNGKDAIVVRAGSVEALKEGILKLATRNSRLTIAKEGQMTAQQKFSAEKMVENYELVLTGRA